MSHDASLKVSEGKDFGQKIFANIMNENIIKSRAASDIYNTTSNLWLHR